MTNTSPEQGKQGQQNQRSQHTAQTPQNEQAPLISLLVPIYNVERYLEECLESARTQTLQNIEIICINDGSTDGSRAIIQTFLDTDPRFRVIDKPNSGYGASMNQGLAAARGDYIGILESDDWLEAEALETMYNAARENDADVVKADFYFYWSVPEERNERFGFVSAETAGVHDPREHTDVFYLKPSIWSAIYRRSFIEENNINFLETPGASYQDAGFNFKVWASTRKVVLIDKAFLHYRQDNEASSINSPGKVYCVCDEYAEMIRFLEARPQDKAELTPILVKMRYDSYMWNYDRLSEELRREWILRMAKDFREEDEAGIIDYALFEPWKVEDRKSIMADPLLFHARQRERTEQGMWGKVKYYYHLGGLPMVMRVAKKKLSRG